ncbi:MAG: nucleic acid-binding protein [Clostridiales bacterium GWE2_32_10]|nr:MAG: nucleic acid-binding protein [Clostridiales bacterium GWE2_32_10]
MQTRRVPLRKCLGCGEMKNKKELIRIVKPAEGDVFVDLTGKANGRGAYICKSVECLNAAKKKKQLERSFKANISEEVYKKLEEQINDA